MVCTIEIYRLVERAHGEWVGGNRFSELASLAPQDTLEARRRAGIASAIEATVASFEDPEDGRRINWRDIVWQ